MTSALRRSLNVSGVLTSLGFIQLYLFSADTDRLFAWTIEPPLLPPLSSVLDSVRE